MRAVDCGLVFSTPDGRDVETAWTGKNVLKDGGRSALAQFLVSATALPPRYFTFGSGTATPSAQGTALQHPITAKQTALTSAIGASGLTARAYCTLGHNEASGVLIAEMALSYNPLTHANPYAWAMALVNGGTGVTHPSGKVATFYWDLIPSTGQNT